MYFPRVIPSLLIRGQGLVKTYKFRKPTYLGDPINIVKIFNEKEVDELIFLDIEATINRKKPPFQLLKDVVSEAFMPVGFGGGVRSIEDVKTLMKLGIEKVIVNTHAIEDPSFIKKAAEYAGSQSIVVSIDVKKSFWGKYIVYTHSATMSTKLDPVQYAMEISKAGAGEILLNNIDRDGTMKGYDLELVKKVAMSVDIPVVACGGARTVNDLIDVVKKGGASAAGAGSMFVFHGPHRAVLISYPEYSLLKKLFGENNG